VVTLSQRLDGDPDSAVDDLSRELREGAASPVGARAAVVRFVTRRLGTKALRDVADAFAAAAEDERRLEVDGYLGVARAYLARGDLLCAREEAVAALRADPVRAETYCLLGEICAREGAEEAAQAFFVAALQIDPACDEARAAWRGAQ
jgi:tetratricopeptide (TPR) repeat protein